MIEKFTRPLSLSNMMKSILSFVFIDPNNFITKVSKMRLTIIMTLNSELYTLTKNIKMAETLILIILGLAFSKFEYSLKNVDNDVDDTKGATS